MNRLREKFSKEIIQNLQKELKIKNANSVPKVMKVVVNVGAGRAMQDKKYIDVVLSTLERITGQKPVSTKARKAISNFKIRQGASIGAMVTLRGERMYDFLDKLISIALPRVRDFRGISRKAIDNQGNLNIGLKEHIVFPEIKSDEIEAIHGMEVTIITSAKDKASGTKLLEMIGIPFQKETRSK